LATDASFVADERADTGVGPYYVSKLVDNRQLFGY
jgi:hypothetical protein